MFYDIICRSGNAVGLMKIKEESDVHSTTYSHTNTHVRTHAHEREKHVVFGGSSERCE